MENALTAKSSCEAVSATSKNIGFSVSHENMSDFYNKLGISSLTFAVSKCQESGAPRIKNVIYSGPATIILWGDGSKTIAKCRPGDTYDKEKGFLIACTKKLFQTKKVFDKVTKRYIWTN